MPYLRNIYTPYPFEDEFITIRVDEVDIIWFSIPDVLNSIDNLTHPTKVRDNLKKNVGYAEVWDFRIELANGKYRIESFATQKAIEHLMAHTDTDSSKRLQVYLTNTLIPQIKEDFEIEETEKPVKAVPSNPLNHLLQDIEGFHYEIAARIQSYLETVGNQPPVESIPVPPIEEPLTVTELAGMWIQPRAGIKLNKVLERLGFQRSIAGIAWEPTDKGKPHSEIYYKSLKWYPNKILPALEEAARAYGKDKLKEEFDLEYKND
jgi:hypothetical protein